MATASAFAFMRTEAHSVSVLPVVATSSTRRILRPAIFSGFRTAKAFRTFADRSSLPRPTCGAVKSLPPERHEIQGEREPLRYLACQDHGLVKTPLPKAFPVQRNRYDQGKNRHIPLTAGKISHDSPQDLTDPDSSPILEEVDRRQERFFVQSDRPGDCIGSLGCEALAAEVVGPVRGGKGMPHRGQRGEWMTWIPAVQGRTEGEGCMFLQDRAAGDAKGREDQVGDPGQDLYQGYISLVSAFRVTVSSGTSIRGASDQSLSKS